MELFSSLPARKDGTLKVTAKSGNSYVFTGSPLRCDWRRFVLLNR